MFKEFILESFQSLKQEGWLPIIAIGVPTWVIVSAIVCSSVTMISSKFSRLKNEN
jgi:hypothetical protein